ncbi:MAG: sugar porter family MFS transporter [Bacteroidales bacterium]
MKPVLLRSALVAALGGLLFGFDTAVISGAEGTLKIIFAENYASLSNYLGTETFWHGFTVASALIGTIVGALSFGKPADLFGRKRMLYILGILYFISALGSALSFNWSFFVIMRFIGGLAVGGSSVVAPMYNAEISPARFRGRMVTLTQFNIVFGILLAYVSNFLIKSMDLGDVTWRWMFGVEAIPALVFVVLLIFNPRSPRWLISKNLVEEARRVLDRVGADSDNIGKEIEDIKASLVAERVAAKERFFQAKYSKPILLAITIAAFNQLSGINAILYYAPRVFSMAGFAEDSAFLSSAVIGFVMLVFTMIAMVIIDHFGRKKLMLYGSIGYIVSLGAIAVTFFSNGREFTEAGSTVVLISLIVFIAAHGFGQGAVIWVFISEIFPNKVRARGQALGSFTHWFMAALISWTFPVFAEISGGFIFTFYAFCMVLQLLWVLFKMPETKGIPLEELQKKLNL